MTTATPENYSVLTGQAYYCSFITPDSYKGGPEVYKGRVLIEEEKAVDLIEYLDGLVADQKDAVLKENPKKKKVDTHDMYSYLDDMPGYVAVTFKQNAVVPMRDGGVWEPKIVIYDAKAKRDRNIKSIPNGATIRVQWTPRPWFQSGANKCGVKMAPQSVQIVNLGSELKAGGGNPFDVIEGPDVYESSETEEVSTNEESYEIEGEEEDTGSDF